jgi:hypothetical protein
MRHIIIAAATPEKIAAKYCFRATSHMRTAQGRLLASFSAYDKSPEVAATVQRACEAMRTSRSPQQLLQPHLPAEDDVECSMVELLMYDTCPTECDGEISTLFH